MTQSSPTAAHEAPHPMPEVMEERRFVMDRVLPLFELEGDEFDKAVNEFVATRIEELPKHSAEKAISIMHGGTEAFIGPETAMVASGMSRAYFLDDISAYTTSFPYVKQYYQQFRAKLPQDRAYVNAVVAGVNFGQAQYFETITGNPTARFNAMADIIDDDIPESNSIADFKKIAVCQERAGVAHNTLQILGIDSVFEVGRMSVQNEDGAEHSEAHAFITCTNTTGDKVIFDPTNPVLVKDEEGGIVSIVPNHFKVEDPTATEASTELKERTVIDGKQVISRSRTVTYSFSPVE